MSSPAVEPIDGGRVRVHVDSQLDLDVQVAADPAFWVEVSPTTDWKSTVLLRHPFFGWTGFSLDLVEAARLAKLLGDNVLVMVERALGGGEGSTAASEA